VDAVIAGREATGGVSAETGDVPDQNPWGSLFSGWTLAWSKT
jgi:hypothetical protein